MNSNQSTPVSAVAALQQEIRTRTEVIRILADLREQLDADRICGAWLSAENNLSASIRRIGEGMWRILVFDHALCYKRLVQDGIIGHACVHSRCEPLRKDTSDCGCNPAGQCWYGCRPLNIFMLQL